MLERMPETLAQKSCSFRVLTRHRGACVCAATLAVPSSSRSVAVGGPGGVCV